MKFFVGPSKGETLVNISVGLLGHAAVDWRRRLPPPRGIPPPRDVEIICCLYGNPRGGGLRRGLSLRGTWTFHVSPRCGIQVYLIPRGGGGPPPRDVDVSIYILPWGLDLGGPLVPISEVHSIVVA